MDTMKIQSSEEINPVQNEIDAEDMKIELDDLVLLRVRQWSTWIINPELSYPIAIRPGTRNRVK